jgi:hypothetical protein
MGYNPLSFKMENKNVYYMGLADLWPAALILGVSGVGISILLNVQADVGEDFTAGTVEANASDDAILGVANIADRMPLIGTVVGAAVLLAILVTSFMLQR